MEQIEEMQEEKKEEKHGWGEEIKNLLKIVIISLLIVLPIRAFIVQPFIVRGDSMETSYSNGEYLIVDEFTYHFNEPKRGDVVVFRYPRNPSSFFIKRIVGLPNERVEIREGKVYIVDIDTNEAMELHESYLTDGTYTNQDTITVLDEKEFFVLGDNRNQSSDSRTWGVLDRRFIVGKAWLRLWPVAKAKVL